MPSGHANSLPATGCHLSLPASVPSLHHYWTPRLGTRQSNRLRGGHLPLYGPPAPPVSGATLITANWTKGPPKPTAGTSTISHTGSAIATDRTAYFRLTAISEGQTDTKCFKLTGTCSRNKARLTNARINLCRGACCPFLKTGNVGGGGAIAASDKPTNHGCAHRQAPSWRYDRQAPREYQEFQVVLRDITISLHST